MDWLGGILIVALKAAVAMPRAASLLLLTLVCLLCPSPSGMANAHLLEGAWRANLTKLPGCAHSRLTCKNWGYFDQDACMSHVPCRQTGSRGFSMWETWDLAPDFKCRCHPGFDGVDCGIVTHQGRCAEGLVLDRTYDATTNPVKAECYIVIDDETAQFGLRHHYVTWEFDLSVGKGTSTITVSSRNKDDAYNRRDVNHPDGGSEISGGGNKWHPKLAPEAGPLFESDWRTCGPMAGQRCKPSLV